MGKEPSAKPCRHTFVFLRQETKEKKYSIGRGYMTCDVFFCTSCLEYKQVEVQTNYVEFGGPRPETYR